MTKEGSSDIAIPVIAGLAVGIALIVLFASFTTPAFTMSDDEIREKARNLPEVQAFYERYTPLEQIKREGTTTYVQYEISRTWQSEDDDPNTFSIPLSKTLQLTVKVDAFGRTSMELWCLSRISGGGPPTVEYILTTPCIEHP